MLPSSRPGRRTAPLKWPNTAELLCTGLRLFMLKRLARKVSRPEASTTKRVAVLIDGMHQRGRASPEFDFGDLDSLAHVRAFGGAVPEQQVVELGAPHLVSRGVGLVHGVGEIIDGRLVAFVVEFGTGLDQPDLVHLIEHAQAPEQRQIERQQRFADVKARVVLLFEQHHLPALLREERRDGRASGTAADDQDIASEFRRRSRRRGGGPRVQCGHANLSREYLGPYCVVLGPGSSGDTTPIEMTYL